MNWGTSFVVPCDTQQEIDDLWRKLSDGGQIIECGWLTDKFGVTWQIVPAVLDDLLIDTDDAKRERVMAALLKMKKLDIEKLIAA
jgi:predicted 3-demethylubiquinone-9 3-methyltransferase (glyoxalase superfamily)